jgi:hypothetical protein
VYIDASENDPWNFYETLSELCCSNQDIRSQTFSHAAFCGAIDSLNTLEIVENSIGGTHSNSGPNDDLCTFRGSSRLNGHDQHPKWTLHNLRSVVKNGYSLLFLRPNPLVLRPSRFLIVRRAVREPCNHSIWLVFASLSCAQKSDWSEKSAHRKVKASDWGHSSTERSHVRGEDHLEAAGFRDVRTLVKTLESKSNVKGRKSLRQLWPTCAA